jgi:hypothetical protein
MWVHKVRQPVLIITAALAGNIAVAKDISCTGTMSDVVNDPRMAFPYAVVYDIENHRTCMLRGLCNAGETCTISGPYRRQNNETYIFDFGDRRER